MKTWILLLLIFTVLVCLDKGITILNLHLIEKNYPNAKEAQDYNAEKNPIARFFFQKFGLIGGTLMYGVISILTLFIAYILLHTFLNQAQSLWAIFIIYGLVIFNNLFFTLKYGGIIP